MKAQGVRVRRKVKNHWPIPIRLKKKMVAPADSNSDTFVDAAVPIYSIHIDQFPTFFLPCTPSAFRQMSMYPYSILTDKDVPLQNFDRRTCTPKTPHDKIFSHDFSQIHLTVYI